MTRGVTEGGVKEEKEKGQEKRGSIDHRTGRGCFLVYLSSPTSGVLPLNQVYLDL